MSIVVSSGAVTHWINCPARKSSGEKTEVLD
jgi:hypothetical protein